MKRLFFVYNKYYQQNNKSGIDFLRDAVKYFDCRNEILNENKSIFKLLLDWAFRVEIEGHTRI